jgi:predicted transcriptional regulator
MSHLNAAEFVDLLDGNLEPERARHADACAMCRRQVDDLRGALASGLAAEQPEPSPLFWESFSARGREGLDAAPERGGRQWLPWILAPRVLAAAAAMAVLAATGFIWRAELTRSVDRGAVVYAPTNQNSTAAAGDPQIDVRDLDPDDAWAAVSAIADSVAWEEAREAGFGAQPGEAERALGSLTDVERARLAALLEAELKKTGD